MVAALFTDRQNAFLSDFNNLFIIKSMSPIVEYKETKSEVKLALLNDETVIGLKETKKGVIVMQNDEAIVLIAAPIMRVVKGIRLMYPNAKFERV